MGENGEEDKSGLEFNVFKFEIIKMCLETLFTEYNQDNDENDSLLNKNNASPAFKIAFNTLIKCKIMKEEDE